mgnify:FL=1
MVTGTTFSFYATLTVVTTVVMTAVQQIWCCGSVCVLAFVVLTTTAVAFPVFITEIITFSCAKAITATATILTIIWLCAALRRHKNEF